MPECGDGIVNGTETCDGDCPTEEDCAALTTDACNPFTLQGFEALCSAECIQSEVVVCVGGDGCCPEGCDLFDADCTGTGEGGASSCGPGEIESCSGATCWDETELGNGECNTFLDCAETNFDGGDCLGGGTGGGLNNNPEDTDTECSDGADNDGDFLTDCDDPSCSDATPCVSQMSGGGGSCDPGEIESCSGATCWDETELGDGVCNTFLNCAQYNFDEGDCGIEL